MISVVHAAYPWHRRLALAFGMIAPALQITIAFAQGTTAPSTGGAAPAGGGGASAAPAGGGGASGTVVVPGPTTYYPGGVAPTAPGQNLGGGNAQYSSSKPVTGNERDNFDFQRGGGGGSVHGDANSSFVIGSGEVRPANTPNMHLVRKGDTLWAICDSYFHNPYQWPRIWAYNPQIQNPHWIYPGEQVTLKRGLATGDLTPPAPSQTQGGSVIDRRKQVPPDTIFLRNEGYIDDDTNNWGEITGAREDKMFLSDYDEVYLRVSSTHDVKIGQELTIFRPVRSVAGGKLIAIQGTVKVDQWNAKDRIARATITESLDAIERGARVGPVARRFEVVAPARNQSDVTATVVTSVHPYNLYGQNQVVFIDQGEEAGLKPGNRLFIIKKGDQYHKSLTTGSSAKRIALEDDSPAATEDIPHPRNESALPEEVQAELRVINVRKGNAMCIVTNSRREIEAGDKAYSRKGY